MNQQSPGIGIKLPSAISHIRECDYQHRLIGSVTSAHRQPSHRDSHRQQRQHPRHSHAPQLQTIAVLLYRVHTGLLVDDKFKASRVHHLLHVGRRNLAFVILHHRRASRQRHSHTLHSVHSLQPTLHIGATSSTCHTQYGQYLLFHTCKVTKFSSFTHYIIMDEAYRSMHHYYLYGYLYGYQYSHY